MSLIPTLMNNMQINESLDDSNNDVTALTFDEFSRFQYQHFYNGADTHDLEGIDPDSNVLMNLRMPSVEYYGCSEFGQLLNCNYTDTTIVMCNIGSIPNNLDNFLLTSGINSYRKDTDILCFCETRLSSDIENIYKLSGYSLITNNRNHYGGGVCTYIRNHISFNHLKNKCISNEFIETLVIEININKKLSTIATIYRRPNGNINMFLDTLDNLLREMTGTNRTCYLLGDFNINLLMSTDRNVKTFIDLFTSYGYYPCINKPTRVSKQSATVIDHIWTNDLETVSKVGILLTDVSDHFAPFLFCKGYSRVSKDVKFTYINYNSLDQGLLCQALQDEIYNITIDNNVNNSFSSITNAIEKVIEKNIPRKTLFLKDKQVNKQWITPELKRHIHERHKLYKKYLKKPISLGKTYKDYRNKVNNMIIQAKRTYYNTKFQDNAGSTKESWKIINEIMGGKSTKGTNITHLNINDRKMTNPAIISDYMNSFFSTIGSNLANDLPTCTVSPSAYLTGNYPDFIPADTTPDEITAIIKSLKCSAPGLDGIHIKVIKATVCVLAPVISKLINVSFKTGIFPDKLKTTKVIPIFKGGDHHNVSNYRPISILNSLSKIFERAMYDRLITFLDNNEILCKRQFGFRKKLSPKIAIIKFVECVLQALGEGQFSIAIFLDLKKAFDTLNHEIMLDKLQHYGIRNTYKNWFKSYLYDRTQCTKVNDTISNYATITTGVPQGSTLGPLLFLLYINDIIESSRLLNFFLFADDTTIVHSGKDVQSLSNNINEELKRVSTWLVANKLSLNIQKTNYIVFSGNKQINGVLNIKMCDSTIQRSHVLRYLGVYIDHKLTWKSHIDHIQSKLSRSLGILHKVKHMLTENTLLTLYYTLFYPYLQYCNVIWGMANSTTLSSLTILQKRIIRAITNVNYYEHTAPLFKSLGILRLDDIYTLECLKLFFEHRYTNIFQLTLASDVHTVSTRRQHYLRPPFPKLELHKRFVMYYGCQKWNEFSDHVKNASNVNTFKIRAKKYIINDY